VSVLELAALLEVKLVNCNGEKWFMIDLLNVMAPCAGGTSVARATIVTIAASFQRRAVLNDARVDARTILSWSFREPTTPRSCEIYTLCPVQFGTATSHNRQIAGQRYTKF
jgi:hypothetical protein